MENSVENLTKIIQKYDIELPQYVNKLLCYTGFDNILSISLMTEKDIHFIEEFARTDLSQILEGDDRKSFYGIYEKKVELFRILEGHKIVLKMLIDCCKTECKEKNKQKRKQVEENKQKALKEKKLCVRSSQSSVSSVASESSNDSENQSNIENIEIPLEPDNFDKNHIESVLKIYIKKILRTDKDKIPLSIKNCLEDIEIPVVEVKGEYFADVTCPCCKKVVKINAKSIKSGKKWILSNFNTHLKTHLTNPDPNLEVSHVEVQRKKSIQKNILSFVRKDVDKSEQNMSQADNDFGSDLNRSNDVVQPILLPNSNQHETQEDNFRISNIFTNTSNVKWKDPKYSRSERYRRSLEVVHPNQPKITNFVAIINDINEILNNEPSKRNSILSSYQPQNVDASSLAPNTIKNLLENLRTTSEKNVKISKHTHRFDEPLKLFSLYLYLVGGRLTYETLYANMNKSLPSITTLCRTLDETCSIKEGVLRIEELKQYLVKRGLPLQVFISEDQTAIIKKVEYDPKTNTMIGFVLPLNENGFPHYKKFTFETVADAEKAFQNNYMANNAYVFMAQPLSEIVPAFCCAVYGTDNKFNYESVLKRWDFIKSETKKYDIEVLGFSSDGDCRCLKAMRILKKFFPAESEDGSNSIKEGTNPYSPYFAMEYNINDPLVIQDTIHIGTKLKTRFLKEGINMTMGKFIVSKDHIKTLMAQVSKDQHCLAPHYLEGSDKMNFQAIDKLSSENVISLLNKVDNSSATKQYLKLTRYILDAFLDKSITVEKRIYKMWYCIFFIRIWRSWLVENNYKIQQTFITQNTYTCIELNGHNLLLAIEKIKTKNTPELFLPWLFSSQPCEKTFRQLRSITSTFSTVVNFSMKEILHRLHRVQALNDITSDLGTIYCFPREENKKMGYSIQTETILPDTAKAKLIIEMARNDATSSAQDLEMILQDPLKAATDMLIPSIHLKIADKTVTECGETSQIEHNEEILQENQIEAEDQEVQNNISLFNSFSDLKLKDYTTTKTISPDSPYVEVVLNDNQKRVVRKSAICWFFGGKTGRLSADRLHRVRGMTAKPRAKTLKKTRPKKKINVNTNKKNLKENDSHVDVFDEETTDTDGEFSLKSDTLSDNFSDLECNENLAENNEINIRLEEYYAVYYDVQWYIGRVIETGSAKSVVKFLTFDLDHYTWPKPDDIAQVDNKYIFYGPFQLTGSCPFYIKRADELKIIKRYRDFKKELE